MSGSEPQPIGIWEPRLVDGELHWVRPRPGPLGDHYATDLVIPQRKTPGVTRVCFFGESVAAGYLYAPHLTPAMVLRRQAQCLGRSLEVVDLARTNETIAPLVGRVEQAMQLDPDVLVLFCGNNWNLLETPELSPYFPVAARRRELAALVAEKGLIGAEEQAAQTVMNRATSAFARIGELAAVRGCRVILVIPEVNMADWESRQPVPHLGGGATAQWYRQLQEAEACRARGDWPALADAARSMLALDGWSSPTGYHLLALARHAMGNLTGARDAFLAEMDCDSYPKLCLLGSPRIGSMGRALQLRSAQFHGFEVVDCRARFEAHTGTPITDRRLFLDYCHLTREGMAVAMAGVCHALEPLTETEHARIIAESVTAVEPGVDAMAFFGAAVHIAHRHPGEAGAALSQWWSQRALAVDPAFASSLLDFMRVRAGVAPLVMSKGYHAMAHLAAPPLLQHGLRYDYSDLGLLRILAQLLGKTHPEALDLLARAEGRVNTNGRPEPVRPIEQWFPVLTPHQDPERRAFFRSPLPKARYWLAVAAGSIHRLKLVLRLAGGRPSAGMEGLVRLHVDDQIVDEFRAGPKWRTHECSLTDLASGAVCLTITWPLPTTEQDMTAVEACAASVASGRRFDWYPVFGELAHLSLTPEPVCD